MALSGEPSSLRWLLGPSEGGSWMVSHGSKPPCYVGTCSRVLCGCVHDTPLCTAYVSYTSYGVVTIPFFALCVLV